MKVRFLSLPVAVVVLLTTACGTSVLGSETFAANTPDIDTMVAMPNGTGVYVGNRSTGVIKQLDPAGHVVNDNVASVKVSIDGQRGLLGLAFDRSGNLYAAWTQGDGNQAITVAQVSPGPTRVVWTGPASSTLANGGRMTLAPDGNLIIGIGDLEQANAIDDPNIINGKLLKLNPNGSSDQKPTIFSSGWHNPFAFTYDNNGHLWVADNSPGDDERLAMVGADGKPAHIKVIGAHNAPSAIAFQNDSLYVCLYNAQRVDRYKLSDTKTSNAKQSAKGCSYDVIAFDNKLLMATNTELRTVSES